VLGECQHRRYELPGLSATPYRVEGGRVSYMTTTRRPRDYVLPCTELFGPMAATARAPCRLYPLSYHLLHSSREDVSASCHTSQGWGPTIRCINPAQVLWQWQVAAAALGRDSCLSRLRVEADKSDRPADINQGCPEAVLREDAV
jgi:hypothetical protein